MNRTVDWNYRRSLDRVLLFSKRDMIFQENVLLDKWKHTIPWCLPYLYCGVFLWNADLFLENRWLPWGSGHSGVLFPITSTNPMSLKYIKQSHSDHISVLILLLYSLVLYSNFISNDILLTAFIWLVVTYWSQCKQVTEYLAFYGIQVCWTMCCLIQRWKVLSLMP